MTRIDGRTSDQLRHFEFATRYTRWAEGSVLAKCGETHVLCNATIDNSLPGWLRNSTETHGWLTAEYAMLPRSTQQRTQREQRWPKGRTQEISRLIGRSLRMAVNLSLLGQRQIIVDCDVLQADGGTRTTAICGAWVAVSLALQPLIASGELRPEVVRHQIVAVSVGLVEGKALLDLAYTEDVGAAVDLNVVMTADGQLVEIQGTAEKAPFHRSELDALLTLAELGIDAIAIKQRTAVQAGGMGN